MEIPIIEDLVIILGGAVAVIFIFQKLKIPTVIGFLITGIIAGPSGFSLVEASHEVEILAEIGVILLLFVIGLEFSLKELAAIKKAVLVGGSLQVFLTIAAVSGILLLSNFSAGTAVFIGFLISLSSTAVGLKMLSERAELNTPHGKISLAILIFQDVIVVPMMLFTPMMAGGASNILEQLLILAIKGILIILFVLVAARYLVPKMLFLIAKTNNRELFLLAIVVICFSVAWLTSSMGLSLALGAFMAGLIISESEYSHQATSNIIPFREIFTSIFFISIGMLLDLPFVFNHLPSILLLTAAVLILKGMIAGGTAAILGYPIRTMILSGLVLFQVGEFAFILSEFGLTYNLLSQEHYQYFLAISILSMGLTPFLYRYGQGLVRLVKGKKIAVKPERLSVKDDKKENHIVIIGYGINGKNVARAAKFAGIPYIIVELNANTVKEEKQKGEPIVYGDAIHPFILSHLNVHKARVVVIAISDPVATKNIVATLRQISPNVYIIVRTRFVNEINENIKLGADEVIPEEFETSIEIFTRVMHKYLVPEKDIEDFVRQIRADNYDMFRPMSGTRPDKRDEVKLSKLDIAGFEIGTLKIAHAAPGITGVKLLDSDLRKKYGINLIGIKREDQFIMDVNAYTEIAPEDVIYVFGKPENILRLSRKVAI